MAVDSDTDSSVDETEKQKILEAVVDIPQLKHGEDKRIKGAGKYKQVNGHPKVESEVLPSLRPTATESVDDNILNTTPEFRRFVAKKLSEMLDRTVQEKDTDSQKQEVQVDSGIRLFTTSKTVITSDAHEEDVNFEQKHVKLKRQKISESDSSDEESKFAEAAVSGDFILQHSALHSTSPTTENLTSQQPPKKKTCVLQSHSLKPEKSTDEPKIKKTCVLQSHSQKPENSSEETRTVKAKKKKKKKKQKSEIKGS